MKKMKKIFALLIAMVMVLGMSTSVFAATITVDDAVDGETYSAYKIMEYTSSGDAYSYFIYKADYEEGLGSLLTTADTEVGFEGLSFKVSADGSQYVLTTDADDVDAEVLAEYLYKKLSTLKTVAIDSASEDADSSGVTFTDLETGYWFVTSSMGSLCTLQSYDDEELVVEKNSMIKDEKEVDENSANAQVGDVLNYTITLTDGKGTNLEATVTDTLSKGLTFNNDAKASINGGAAAAVTPKVTANEDGTTTVVYTFDADTMTTLEEGQTIVITYTATVNDDASIDGSVSNTEYTEYSEQKTNGNTVDSDLTDLTVNKTDGKDALKGAQFQLYRTDEALELTHVDVKLRQLTDAELTAAGVTKADDTVYYTVDPEGTNLIDMAQKDGEGDDAEYLYSSAVVFGLDKDSTYYLEETKAPEGYNLLDAEETVNLGSTTSIDVVNNAGSVLPSTGGIGTTIFYIVGAILVIGAGVVLVTRRRMSANK